ncbi:TetR/AcrR family transcriptional regulator [Desulfitobacterium metallireducens]|uniref:HTH tetR-type domain-containing protein n=1 Tax=Desulfitobacterium metallireducens DSM 15288 TaxID=871968 RepID=W0ED85_9FIRM|nr:TetR/AcrR family transcriptional regulator [Desulfitobacterium metallireducens]AHF08702.1 hypothetical protein DESME_15040 [Desulfitobacterium metallireducens DSM 15288]
MARLKPEDTRQKIMDSAQRLFVERGYFNTVIPDIVRDSKISIGSIYHHFSNKQDLAKALYEETLQSFTREMHSCTDPLTDVKNKLYAMVQFIYTLCEDSPIQMEYMLFVRHNEIFPEQVPICLSEPFQAVEEWIEDGIASGDVIPGQPLLLAGVFMGGILKVVELKLRGVLKEPLPEVVDKTFTLAWRSIAK